MNRSDEESCFILNRKMPLSMFISSKRKSLGGLQKTFAILSFLGYNEGNGGFAL